MRIKITLIIAFTLGIIATTFAQQYPGMPAKKQTVKGKITGIVKDSITKAAVEFATITLLDAKSKKPVSGAIADANGKFTISEVSPASYLIRVGFIGYAGYERTITTTPSKPDLNLSQIVIKPTTNTLAEVTVEGKKQLIENKVDKMVYNAENDITNAGSNAEEMLRKVPMVSVDMDGNVQLRGSSSVRILINGKPSGTMANSVADALKMIPADQVKNVEVITNPSAKYDAEGAGGIINIITKKNTAKGINASVNLSAGTRMNNGSANVTAKSGRLTLTGNVGGNLFVPQNSTVELYNQNFANNTIITQNGASKVKRQGINAGLGLDYDINQYNNISTNFKFNDFLMATNGSVAALIAQNSNNSNYTRTTDSENAFGGFDWTMDYRKTFEKASRELTFSGQLSKGTNTTDFSTIISGEGATTLINNNNGKNNEYTIQTDYVEPVSDKFKLEMGVKGVFRNIISAYGSNTNMNFDYNQNVQAGYTSLNYQITKTIAAQVGARVEATQITGLGSNDNNYFNFFPNALISKNLTPTSTLKLSYNRRIQRPSLFFLNPFVDQSDPQNRRSGNPLLLPELSNQYELGYSNFFKGVVINASVYYRRTSNIIESVYDPNYKITTFQNVGVSPIFGSNVFISLSPIKKLTVQANMGISSFEVINPTTKVSTGVSYNKNAFIRSSYAITSTLSADAIAILNAPRRTFQGQGVAFNMLILALKKQIWNKAGSIGITANNPFYRTKAFSQNVQNANFIQNSVFTVPFRSFGVTFSYNFGKLQFTQKKSIKNDDLKNGDGGGQMGGMGM